MAYTSPDYDTYMKKMREQRHDEYMKKRPGPPMKVPPAPTPVRNKKKK